MERGRSILLLDGGTGHELKRRGVVKDGSFLEGVLANENRPQIVSEVHQDFLRSGCDVITTNSFVAVPERIQASGICASANDNQVSNGLAIRKRTAEIIAASVRCAQHAVDTVALPTNPSRPQIAGCVPPLHECYVGHLVPKDTTKMVSDYTHIISTLVHSGVDILLAETLSTTREALAIIQATNDVLCETEGSSDVKTPELWITFTIHDDLTCRLRSGEFLQAAVHQCFHLASSINVETTQSASPSKRMQIHAIGVNCSSPQAVTAAIPVIVAAVATHNAEMGLATPRVLAYANAFRTTTSEWLASIQTSGVTQSQNESVVPGALIQPEAKDFDSEGCILTDVYCRHVTDWIGRGATIIGGCCGCTPRHMKAIAKSVAEIS